MSRSTLAWPISVIALMLGMILLMLASPIEAPQAAPAEQVSSPTPNTSSPTPTTATATVGPTATTAPAQAPAQAPTPTQSPTPGTATPATATVTVAATNTSAPIASLTPLPGEEGAIACLPGQTIYLEGEGPPSTALLIYFDEQAVGGGTSNAEGYYRLKLVIGDEKTGTYRVQVRIRGTRQVVQEVVCGVLESTATPTRARRTTPP